MKRRIWLVTVLVMLLGMFNACGTATTTETEEQSSIKPEEEQVRAICELATLECYYHNVAKSTKTKGTGITGWGEKDRDFWIEYTGVAKVGIDMSKVKMETDEDNHITIYLPEAKVMNVDVQGDTLNYIASEDGWNKNTITAEDETAAINQAQKEMEQTVKKNSSLLMNAQERAKKLIENYITQLGDAVGVTYDISWVYEDSSNATESTQ
jgi:type III secretory pathway component EscV